MTPRCLIVYPFVAHYRLQVFLALMQRTDWEFEIISDRASEAGIRGVDPSLAERPIALGGLRWSFVENLWLLGRRLPLLWQRELMKRLRRKDYVAVIFLGNVYHLSTWVGVGVAKARGARVLIWTHGFLGGERYWVRLLRHGLYRQADRCLLFGERAAKLMRDSGFYPPGALRVVYNSMDYGSMDAARATTTEIEHQKLRASVFDRPSDPVVIAVGRLIAGKRLELLIEAVFSLRARGVAVNCLIVGDGSERDGLEALSRARGLERVVCFWGSAYGQEVDRLLLASDLCVVPGDVGLVVMHAFAAGLPVVTHDRFSRQGPEYEAIEAEVTGSFYRYGSLESLIAAMEGWFREPERLRQAEERCLAVTRGRYSSAYQSAAIVDAVASCCAP